MKKLSLIIKDLKLANENSIVYSSDELGFVKYVDESLRQQPGYSAETSDQIFEDLKKMYGSDFDSAKKYFDQNFQ